MRGLKIKKNHQNLNPNYYCNQNPVVPPQFILLLCHQEVPQAPQVECPFDTNAAHTPPQTSPSHAQLHLETLESSQVHFSRIPAVDLLF